MHRKPDSRQRHRRRGRAAREPGRAPTGRRQRRAQHGARRTGAARGSADLLANLCAVMALFPAAGDAAIGEMVAKLQTDQAAGAATAKGRRAGKLRRRQRRRTGPR